MFSRAAVESPEIVQLSGALIRLSLVGARLQAATGVMTMKKAEHQDQVEMRTLSHLSFKDIKLVRPVLKMAGERCKREA
jgi:hypothetical protein